MRKYRFLLYLSIAILLIFSGGAVAFVWTLTTTGFSARREPYAAEIWLARHARDLATPRSVKSFKNPIQATPLTIAEARDHFADHCATCHGNIGDGKTMIGNGMFPPPPNLRDAATQSLTDGELFNIIKEGIRFTGMPGFGGSDEDNWKLVNFIRHIPKLTGKEIQFMNEINKLGTMDTEQ